MTSPRAITTKGTSANCIYWYKDEGGRCIIVDERGTDTMGKESGVIARHGCCNLWEPNWDEIRE